MFSKLLVALDGSVESGRILPLASTLARVTGGELHLVRVIAEDADFKELDDAVRYLASMSTDVDVAGLPVHTNVLRGGIDSQILQEVDRVNADVVLMTTHGRGGLKRAVMGSVTEKVLKQSGVPVLALRTGGKVVSSIRTIVVPMDDSLGSALALRAAKFIAGSSAARIDLLHVVEPLVRYFRGRYIEPEWEEATRARAQADMEALASSLRSIGFNAHGRAVLGPVGPSIVTTAHELAADLIVMTTSSHTGATRAILGSVADQVVRTSEVPVLLLHFNLEDGLLALRESASEAGQLNTRLVETRPER